MQDRTIERIARLGYAARGVVYWLVGGLALLAALGSGGAATDSKGALQKVLSQPFGTFWLVAIAVGLVCFSAWRTLQSLLDVDRLGKGWKAIARRVAYGFSVVAHLALAVTAAFVLLGIAAPGDAEGAARGGTAWLLSAPFGRWLVALLGTILAGVGLVFAYKGVGREVGQHLVLDRYSQAWVVPLGRAGFATRGVVFALAGFFLLRAAMDANAGEARGLAGTLRALQAQPYGWALLAVTAFGLFCFGAFQFAVARYRHIDASKATDLAEEAKRSMTAATTASR